MYAPLSASTGDKWSYLKKRKDKKMYKEMIILTKEEVELTGYKRTNLVYAIELALRKKGYFYSKDMFNFKTFKHTIHVYLYY